MASPYQDLFDEADALDQPEQQRNQPYPTPATDRALGAVAKVVAQNQMAQEIEDVIIDRVPNDPEWNRQEGFPIPEPPAPRERVEDSIPTYTDRPEGTVPVDYGARMFTGRSKEETNKVEDIDYRMRQRIINDWMSGRIMLPPGIQDVPDYDPASTSGSRMLAQNTQEPDIGYQIPSGIPQAPNMPYVMPEYEGSTSPEPNTEEDKASTVDALKKGGITYGDTTEPELQAQHLNRDIEVATEDFDILSKEHAVLQEKLKQQRESVYKTATMNIEGQEWEVPVPQGLEPYVEGDIKDWPQWVLDYMEEKARDNLEQGKDPFGSPIPEQEHD